MLYLEAREAGPGMQWALIAPAAPGGTSINAELSGSGGPRVVYCTFGCHRAPVGKLTVLSGHV